MQRRVYTSPRACPRKSPTSSILAGISGEYFVAGELSRRGWIASLTLRNTRGVDIPIAGQKHEGTNRPVGVQRSKPAAGPQPEVDLFLNNAEGRTMTVIPRSSEGRSCV